jgi:hypothetical protein
MEFKSVGSSRFSRINLSIAKQERPIYKLYMLL